jgi:hypothetical protein
LKGTRRLVRHKLLCARNYGTQNIQHNPVPQFGKRASNVRHGDETEAAHVEAGSLAKHGDPDGHDIDFVLCHFQL